MKTQETRPWKLILSSLSNFDFMLVEIKKKKMKTQETRPWNYGTLENVGQGVETETPPTLNEDWEGSFFDLPDSTFVADPSNITPKTLIPFSYLQLCNLIFFSLNLYSLPFML